MFKYNKNSVKYFSIYKNKIYVCECVVYRYVIKVRNDKSRKNIKKIIIITTVYTSMTLIFCIIYRLERL